MQPATSNSRERTALRVGGLSTIVFALATVLWFALEIMPANLGFEDTDSPSVMLAFLRAHGEIYVYTGLVLLLMSLALTGSVLGAAEAFASRIGSLSFKATSAMGLMGAAFFMLAGGIRIWTAGPLLHIADLKAEWGESGYVAAQAASQTFLITGILGLGLWAVGLSVFGGRARAIPLALALLGVLPAIRLVTGTLGPTGLIGDSEAVWILSLLAIPGTSLWCLLLGLVLLRRGYASATGEAEFLPA
ncbi:MAG: hypothetical protein ABI555_02080 [Chloroflexota bacterium]